MNGISRRLARRNWREKSSGEVPSPWFDQLSDPLSRGEKAGSARQRSKPRARREPDQFKCRQCGMSIVVFGAGSEHRNHCPNCLHSVHVDVEPGDRAANCGGLMEPIGVWVRKGGEWAIIHRCRTCGALSSNRIAADDHEVLLLSIAVRPLASPPFPLEQVLRR